MDARKKSLSGGSGSPDLKPKWEKVVNFYRFVGFGRILKNLTEVDRS